MSTTWIILGIVILAIVTIFLTRSKGTPLSETKYEPKRKCNQCDYTIPQDYVKSLCPQCKSYLVK